MSRQILGASVRRLGTRLGCVLALGLTAACGGTDPSSDGLFGDGSLGEGTLSLGARGPAVKAVYDYLARYGYFQNAELAKDFPWWQPMVPEPASPDIFDTNLELALTKYQKNSGLEPSGVLDIATREQMALGRCGYPDSDPDATERVDKWAHFGCIPGCGWGDQTTITFGFPRDLSLGDLNGNGRRDAEDITLTGQAILEGLQTSGGWGSATDKSFQVRSANIEVPINFVPQPAGRFGYGKTPSNPRIELDINHDFTHDELVSFVRHEMGHVIGLDHSSLSLRNRNYFPIMFHAPAAARTTLKRDDRVAANILYNSWQRISGPTAADVDVGGADVVWMVDTSGNAYIRSSGSWLQRPGPAAFKRIATCDYGRAAVAVGTNGRIYRYNGSWSELPGNGRAIAVGCPVYGGSIWILGLNGYAWYHNGTTWVARGGIRPATEIDVDYAGRPWTVTGTNINNLNMLDFDGQWKLRVGLAQDIGLGGNPDTDFPYDELWLTSSSDRIYVQNAQTAIDQAPYRAGFVEVGGRAKRIAVGATDVWVVNSSGNVYARREL